MTETADYDKSATPSAHKTSHQAGGGDEISVAGLAGELTAAQKSTWAKVSGKPTTFTPSAHKTSHQAGGGDEISVEGLAGELTAAQKSTWAKVSGKPTEFNPEAHHADHETGGADALVSYGTKTTAAWNKTIGPTGDYATFAAMIADMPDLLAHAVTVTIQAGTTLPEMCSILNKHGITSSASITVQAEKYFPRSGQLPTADSATATTLRDAALAAAAKGDDYFNGCWVFVVHGTGTDNGFVSITDYVDATGDVVVASWPGTQPDATSRYLIVGALVDGDSTRTYCIFSQYNFIQIIWKGIGLKGATAMGSYNRFSPYTNYQYCGVYDIPQDGFLSEGVTVFNLSYCGIVKCNTNNSTGHGGIFLGTTQYGYIAECGISDNGQRGVLARNGGYSFVYNNFGDNNGTWGTYAMLSGQAYCPGTECSGSLGDHSNGAGDGSLAY